MSVDANNMVSCLKQAIRESKPVDGTFVRGINVTRRKPLNDETISDYVFNNAGFASAAFPELNLCICFYFWNWCGIFLSGKDVCCY